jgi:hypothetical protein
LRRTYLIGAFSEWDCLYLRGFSHALSCTSDIVLIIIFLPISLFIYYLRLPVMSISLFQFGCNFFKWDIWVFFILKWFHSVHISVTLLCCCYIEKVLTCWMLNLIINLTLIVWDIISFSFIFSMIQFKWLCMWTIVITNCCCLCRLAYHPEILECLIIVRECIWF